MTQARDPLATTRARARVKELDLLELYLVATEVSRILISNMRCVLQVTTHIKVSHTQNEHMLISYTHNEHDYVLQVKLDPLDMGVRAGVVEVLLVIDTQIIQTHTRCWRSHKLQIHVKYR